MFVVLHGFAIPCAEGQGSPGMVNRGRVAFEQNCTQCHDADRSLNKQKSLAGWLATVRRMAALDDADIPADEIQPIAEYLADRNSVTAETETTAEMSTVLGSGISTSGTLAPYWRGGNDNIENPNFFPDAWLTVDWQPEGRLRGRATACTSCHSNESGRSGFTLEMVEAYVALDMLGNSPCATQDPRCGLQVNSEIRFGRVMVPFGGYANANPSIQKAVTLPLMFNMGQQVERVGSRPPVLPMPYADEGALIHNVFRRCDIVATLDIYGVNGLQASGPGIGFTASRSYTDNNTDVAFGSRATIGNKWLRVGGSWMSGRHHTGVPLSYHLAGIDSTLRILDDDIRLHFEYALRRNDSSSGVRQIAYGTVTEFDALLWSEPNLHFLCRYDTLEHRDFFGDASTRRFTWGVSSSALAGSRVMLNHEHWRFSDTRPTTDLLALRWVATF